MICKCCNMSRSCCRSEIFDNYQGLFTNYVFKIKIKPLKRLKMHNLRTT